MYMVRQLASALGLADQLASAGERYANTGSCSVPLAIASSSAAGRALLAGFGAGLSASAALVRIPPGIRRGVVHEGPAKITVPAPLECLPYFER